ncbi:Protein NRT1/ PTR FAMILY 4.2 [Cardamine amara subsp. amara]|uniref:Protein NRT1/ PTR FAMILY 4.2 n=1 Tax=Cardamine amara subsp. amara TaxID=228776 RepID=A0ABD0ZBM9_CARAN
MNCCVAQLLTFTVQQGMTMNREISPSFEIPVPSLNVISTIFILAFIPLYELFSQRINRTTSFSLKRIGRGLTLSSISMAVAAIVEANRKHEAVQNDYKISVFWLMFQYLMLSFSDIVTLGGMQEFFFKEAPASMKSISIALGWCSTAMGFFLSSFLVEITNAITGKFGHQWLDGEDLNKSRLDLFYVLICVLNTINLLNYIFWAKRY